VNLDQLRRDFDIVPMMRELSADALTPVAAFAALSGEGTEAFLFESVERGENLGRYSFVGFDPRRSIRFDRTTPDPAALLNEIAMLEEAGVTVRGNLWISNRAQVLLPCHRLMEKVM